ncbi:hypothetical protein ACSBR2_039495 [Camellia fascicularis]
MVGFEDEAMKMKEQLTGHKHLNIISIVGMPGLGKTTLARKVSNDPLIIYHFYIRMWICVSQNYQTRNVLLGLLSSIKHRNDTHELSDGKLSELLYKCLKGKRYLVVMDDIWDSKVWVDLKIYFPNDNNGSRVLFTSRHQNVTLQAKPSSPPFSLCLLTNNESWDLFRLKVECLQMKRRAFPEDLEIPVWKWIWLWIAEGFIPKMREKSLEDVAEEYLMDLIGRNLILVSKRKFDGGIKACGIHDLLRDFCLKKAEKKCFLQQILAPNISSFLCFRSGCTQRHRDLVFPFFKPLTVLDISCIKILRYPYEIEQLVLLRELDCETSDGEFPPLKFLKLNSVPLVDWKVSCNHFPKLQGLVLIKCYCLKKIPSEIGNIPTLQMIEVHGCNPSIAAREIKEEQENMRNHWQQIIESNNEECM